MTTGRLGGIAACVGLLALLVGVPARAGNCVYCNRYHPGGMAEACRDAPELHPPCPQPARTPAARRAAPTPTATPFDLEEFHRLGREIEERKRRNEADAVERERKEREQLHTDAIRNFRKGKAAATGDAAGTPKLKTRRATEEGLAACTDPVPSPLPLDAEDPGWSSYAKTSDGCCRRGFRHWCDEAVTRKADWPTASPAKPPAARAGSEGVGGNPNPGSSEAAAAKSGTARECEDVAATEEDDSILARRGFDSSAAPCIPRKSPSNAPAPPTASESKVR